MCHLTGKSYRLISAPPGVVEHDTRRRQTGGSEKWLRSNRSIARRWELLNVPRSTGIWYDIPFVRIVLTGPDDFLRRQFADETGALAEPEMPIRSGGDVPKVGVERRNVIERECSL